MKLSFGGSKIIVILNIMILSLLTGCGIYKPVQVGEVSEIKLKQLSLSSISFLIKVPIENPNGYKLQIKESDLDISINGIELSNVSSPNEVIIGRKFKGELEFPIDVKLKGLGSGTMAVISIFKQRDADLEITGYIKVKAFLLSKKIHIKEKNNVRIF